MTLEIYPFFKEVLGFFKVFKFECDGKSGSVVGNFKFALGFALECDLETTQSNAIYAQTSSLCFHSSMVNASDEGEKISKRVFCFVISCLSSLMRHVSCVLLIGLSSSYQQAQVVICNYKFFCISLPLPSPCMSGPSWITIFSNCYL
jgi:hypothetical protein